MCRFICTMLYELSVDEYVSSGWLRIDSIINA